MRLNCDRNIGAVIRKLRESKGLKQSDVITFMQLHSVPMTKSAYSKIEGNKQHLKISEICMLKQCFGVSYNAFFEPLE